ncbi:hypothetical protein KP509_24G010900 [Ceratopteris richardii]|uniref:(+)-neomenthol dehydrogenase n=1 Tax=Ceratopteris richardii TaxID=49495 RepID=A0A8T2RSH1_CERRI|nr:hypothetical protein KP509_24G010900 [Ceratopteris richardii]
MPAVNFPNRGTFDLSLKASFIRESAMDACRSSKWWSEDTIAVVTGGNKGIGFEVCKQFATAGLKVVLTARDTQRGQEALQTLKHQGFENVSFHQLDITDEGSCAAFASWLFRQHGGFDVLVNNAGINGIIVDEVYVKENNIKVEDLLGKEGQGTKGFIVEYESAKACIETNYYGTKYITQALLPLLRFSAQGARIVNVGSSMGQLSNLRCPKLQQELSDLEQLSEAYLDELLDRYLNDVKQQSWEDKCWPLKFPSYKMSKIALHAYTRLLATQLEKEFSDGKVFVNCVDPGSVREDIAGVMTKVSAPECAENVVWVALLPFEDCPTGQFFLEKKLATF